MAYLFIDFSRALEQNNNKSSFYNLSLEDQYDLIKKRIPLLRRPSSFKSLMDECFPSGLEKRYYISCPNFLREINKKEDRHISFLNNLVIRPELTLSMKERLPSNQNIILIGDIFAGDRVATFQVKGIELIDNTMSSPNDLVISAPVCSSYYKNVWSIDHVNLSDTCFTPNFIHEIINSCFTVENPAEVRKTYDLWKEYFDFRDYYLKEQSNRHFILDSAEYIESYAVNKKEYKRHQSVYENYLLDGRSDLSKGDMVILSQHIEQSESFPLIKLTINRNKKAFEAAKVNKRGRNVNEEENKIRSLASDNVFITEQNPNIRIQTKDGLVSPTLGILLNQGYALGERFKVISYDIKPEEHLAEAQKEHEKKVDDTFKAIDRKYSQMISDEFNNLYKAYSDQLANDSDVQIQKKKKELDDSINRDIKENKDTKIASIINAKTISIKNEVRKKLKQDKKESAEAFNKRIEEVVEKECQNINIRELYINRNTQIINDLTSSLKAEEKRALTQFEIAKRKELNNKYQDDIRNDKATANEKLIAELKKEKEQIIENETIIQFALYFRLGDSNNNISELEKEKISKCKYIVYDNRAEMAKLKRQKLALDNFYSGNVKNPYLSTYLFNPDKLKEITPDYIDWVWYLDSLNERQKEAVRKAVYSNGVFLLQGPPGTGKTQVIAETVAQLVKKGKKVLISSETHKAIDNVFERLPKIAEILPIRLVPSHNDKQRNNDYDPKYLVDNFYLNISDNMKKSINRYKNFRRNKEEFSESYNSLKLLKTKIEKIQNSIQRANNEVSELEKKSKSINEKITSLADKQDEVRIDIDTLRRTKRHIENNNLNLDGDINTKIMLDYRDKLMPLQNKADFKPKELAEIISNLALIKMEDVRRESAVIDPKSNNALLEVKKARIKEAMAKCRDEYDEVLPEKKAEYDALKKELISIVNQKDNNAENKLSDMKLSEIFQYQYLIDNLSDINEIVMNLKEDISTIRNSYLDVVDRDINMVQEKFNDFESKIIALKKDIKNINNQILDIQDRDEVKDNASNVYKLESGIAKFFKDFEISEPYNDIDEALRIIAERWNELENDFAKKETENKEKIPMYEKISKYLLNEEILEEDRKTYTKSLFESANVFGITCTSSDRFRSSKIESLSDYNIDDIDIKSVGIDVVIIDEVSKSSFIDLLIPILYGKTVILVGDHRQLPPMYDLAKMNDEEYEGLDENIINKEKNEKFRKLYEECFFKTLFEKIPNCYKTMLVQQYRCHEHIMHVFNHFYQQQLKLGFPGQNNNKKHDIKIISNGRSIIDPSKHVYFINCRQNETRDQDSTSIYNNGEAKAVVDLIRKLNGYFTQNPRDNSEKLSIGVICTYGDQARRIKELMKIENVKTNSFKTDSESMIISTVDDFQGDERDIIILSTVRNPENPAKSNPGFILAYQRINVALSRARRMLVVVGNRKYLENKGIIDLPDISGDKRKDRRGFRVYEEIISTIERYGKVIEDTDVYEESEGRVNG